MYLQIIVTLRYTMTDVAGEKAYKYIWSEFEVGVVRKSQG